MESEPSGIFWEKLVAKNIVLGPPGIHFIHMRVKEVVEVPVISSYFYSLLANLHTTTYKK